MKRQATVNHGEKELESRIIFLHIPKTAGSTLYRIIERNCHWENIYTVWVDGSIEDLKNLDRSRQAQIRLLRGHLGFGVHQYLPGSSLYFTILREPLERLISYYHFVRRSPRHYCYDLVTSYDMSLDEFITSSIDTMVDNAQTRLLSGIETGHEVAFGHCSEEMLETAKRNLRENVHVVGLTEEFDKTLFLLKKAFNWRWLFYVEQNVSSNRFRKRELSSATLDILAGANRFDIELYQYATELFAEQVRQHGVYFAKEIKSFQSMNRRLSPLTHLYWETRKFPIRTMIRRWIQRLLG